MTSITERRTAVCDWAEYITDGENGRRCSDPVYQWAVEGRDPGPKISSCALMAHKLLFLAGCRDDAINLTEHQGYKSGVAVSRLAYWKGVVQDWGRTALVTADALRRTLQRGDICILWTRKDTTDAHVCVFDRVDDAGNVHTWDAGQGPMNPARWVGQDWIEADRKVRLVSAFPIKKFISLDRVPWAAEPLPACGETFDALEAGKDLKV